ncbi:MAG: hypothetical protein ABSF32_07855 [Ignavibacteria bacterium]|jgi:hypothetical protein
MALVKKLEKIIKEHTRVHSGTDCTYVVFSDSNGDKYLQLDTVGSKNRQMPGKISQSIQFGPEAIKQLKDIIKNL